MGNSTSSIEERKRELREFVTQLDADVNKLWRLGRNIVVGWYANPDGASFDLMMLPYYCLPQLVKTNEDVAFGARALTLDQLNRVSNTFKVKPIRMPSRMPAGLAKGGYKPIENVIRRYSITKTPFRAAALIEVCGLDKHSSVEQVTLLNSLSYSINVAQKRMMEMDIKIDLARINTRRGFLIWNRAEGASADVTLYYLMALVLADNALARLKGTPNTAPRTKAAFHIDSHYEYFQPEGLSPRVQNIIIGNVTEKLEQIVANAKTDQITIGRFARPDTDNPIEEDVMYNVLDSARFLARCQNKLDYLEAMKLSGHRVTSIKNYMTGKEISKGAYDISLYGFGPEQRQTQFFNIKLNIYRGEAETLFIGLQDKDLVDFGETNDSFDPTSDIKPYVREARAVVPENKAAQQNLQDPPL